MFLKGLDELDQKIVELLIKNARMSYSDIGEQVGISRVAVKSRISALEEKGVIEGYTTIVNPQKISGALSCYFDIETEPGALERVAETPGGLRHGHPGLPGDGKEPDPRSRGGVRTGGDGIFYPECGRLPGRSGVRGVQHHSVPDQGCEGAPAVNTGIF